MSSTAPETPQQLLAEDHEALDALLRAVIGGFYQSDSATLLDRLDLFWARLAMHIRAENLCLFPAIIKACANSLSVKQSCGFDPIEARQAIDRLRIDHDFFMHELAEAVKIMRRSTVISETEPADQVRQIVLAVKSRLKSHNQLEEQFVYSLPEKVLASDEQSDLATRIRRELENLPPRFAKGWDIAGT